MPLVVFDESQWPIVTLTWGKGEASDGDVAGMLAKVTSYLERKERFGLVLDARAGEGVSAKHRQIFAQFQKENAVHLKQFCVIALVLATALQRGLVTAINWIVPSPGEQRVFSSTAEAQRWLDSRVKLDGAAHPPA